jgi:DNA-binding CsgD family transcriptional regulator
VITHTAGMTIPRETMLRENELRAIGKDLLDDDPDRGVVLLTLEGRVVYANTAANNLLRDGSERGSHGLLPAAVEAWIHAFVAHQGREVRPSAGEYYYPDENAPRVRITIECITTRDHVPYVVLRVLAQVPWTEPTVRRLEERFGLTLREAQVAAVVARGHTNAEVAAKLGIVEKTVKNVLMAVYHKCSVRNRVELALRAFDVPVSGLRRRRS